MVGNKIADICPVKGQIDRNARFNGISWQIRIKLFDENKEVQYKLKKASQQQMRQTLPKKNMTVILKEKPDAMDLQQNILRICH